MPTIHSISLFDFQREDVEFLACERSALIANEMGTGKTYEAIARDALIREATTGVLGPEHRSTLVVAPLTTLSMWADHFGELTNLKAVAVNTFRTRSASWKYFLDSKADVFLVHWQALRLMPELTTALWTHIIADECHNAKNRKAQQTKALKAIKSVQWKTAMSGTPVVNRPDELWSILNWLRPDQYKSYWKFFNKYVDWETKYAGARTYKQILGPRNLQYLRQEIKPFYVRRRKVDVLKDLPDKYYTTVKVDLTPDQRKAYNDMRDHMIAWVGEQKEDVLPAPVIIAQLTRLQQFACSYASITSEGLVRMSEPSSKLDAVMEVLDETDEQVVVFSRFRQVCDLLEARLRDKSISYVTLTGNTPQEARGPLVSGFQGGSHRVFIGTIAAGGVGITLHAASRVIFVDRDWSPALNAQAEDRLHRIGQKNAVQVIDIIARNTVDLGKAQRLDVKKSWIRQILGDTA